MLENIDDCESHDSEDMVQKIACIEKGGHEESIEQQEFNLMLENRQDTSEKGDSDGSLEASEVETSSDDDIFDLNLEEMLINTQINSFEKERMHKIRILEKQKLAKKNFKEIVVIEKDFIKGEQVFIEMDVYNIFIAANYTKNCSPI